MKTQIARTFGVLLLLTVIAHRGLTQQITLDFIEFTGRNVIVHYTLDDGANSTRQFLLQLYSSQDNYTAPLTRVTGDVGSEVTAGLNKKITWDITQELGAAYKGNIALEIRGRVYVPFVRIEGIEEGKVFKRGKNYPLNWTSGNLSGQVNIELFNSEGERLWGENNVSNIGKFDWYLPGNIKRRSGYRLKFTNVRDRNDVVYSHEFTIKPRIPLIVKIAGVVLVGAAVEFVLATKKTATDEEDHKSLPVPLNPPN